MGHREIAVKPWVIAHRGARSLAPENTLPAFRKAVALGADAVECDVHLTRDAMPVVFHDFTLERCTDFAQAGKAPAQKRSPFLGDWTFEELRGLDAGSWFAQKDPFGQVKAGRVSAQELDSYRGERIPALGELLELCRSSGIRLVLEVKQAPRPSDALVQRCVEELRAAQMIERTVLISFDHPTLLLAKSIEPALATGALLVERLADPGRYARDTLGAQLVSVHFPEGAFARCAPAETYLAADIRGAHAAGVAYHVWTVNASSDFLGLAEIEVDGIATDFPQELIASLGERRERR
jgi:glycerophosphoryl diester phosphodiesterase